MQVRLVILFYKLRGSGRYRFVEFPLLGKSIEKVDKMLDELRLFVRDFDEYVHVHVDIFFLNGDFRCDEWK